MGQDDMAETESVANRATAPGGGPPRARLFLSYARGDDEPFVRRLYEDLRAHGFEVWLDRVDLPSRQLTFHQEIKDAIRTRTDRLIHVAEPKAALSDYVREEWQFAMELDRPVVPILRLGDFDLVPGSLLRWLEGRQGVVDAFAIRPDGRTRIAASSDDTLKLWDLASGRLFRSLVGHQGGVSAVSITPDGRTAVSASPDRTIKLWDLASGRLLASFSGDAGFDAAAIAPSDSGPLEVVAGDALGRIHILDLLLLPAPDAPALHEPPALPRSNRGDG